MHQTPSLDQRSTTLVRLSLLVIATAQLMLVLDDLITNIALPTIQDELKILPTNLSWVINSYILAFGGMLLFGGRLGDLVGRRRILQYGLAIFTFASLLAGLASNSIELIAARTLQGIGAALTAPNILALIATTFSEGKQRNTAMAVYGAMSGLGMVTGLLLGGILTAWLGWRWVFFINVPIGVLVIWGSRVLIEAELHEGKLNLGAAISSVVGMAALIFSIIQAGKYGLVHHTVIVPFIIAVVLITFFVLVQKHATNPLLPMRLFSDLSRAGSYTGALLLAFGPMGTLYLMTLYMQDILKYSALKTGLAWLPFALGIISGAALTSHLLIRISPRILSITGAVIASISMLSLSLLTVKGSYMMHIMPGMFGEGFGFVMGILSLTLTAVSQVPRKDSGIASALLNASQQIGVALGLAILATVFVSSANTCLPDALSQLRNARLSSNKDMVYIAESALIHGYSTALIVGSFVIFVSALIILMLSKNRQIFS